MCERAERVGNGELKNNNQQVGLLADGDANANELRTEDGGRKSGTGALSGLVTETAEQGKIIIWGTDSQCDDPELAEFEMLECQELEAYLVEEGEDFVGLAERKDLLGEHATSSKCGEDRKSTPCGGSEHESSASVVSEYRDTSKTELSSEADIFVTCPSSFSTMDTAGRTQTTDSWHHTSGPYSTISEDLTLVSQTGIMAPERDKADRSCDSSGRTTRNERHVDMNLNSTAHQQDGLPQAQVTNGVLPCKDATDKHNDQRYTEGYVVSEQERSSVHKGSPTAKKSQQESNSKTDKSTQADDIPDVNYNPLKIATIVDQSSAESKAMKKQNSFDKSVKKQPSFENTLKKQLSFDNTLKKQRSFENTHTSSSSSLERRKPWGSPSRSATPTSSKTTSCSPNRRPPGSPAKVQGIRSLSLERSDSLQRGSGHTVKLPAKTSLSSSIPKPVLPQQKEPEPRRCSPPQKPRNIRPKIITYVRKNPQAKSQVTDAPPDVSTIPLRATSYCSPPAHRDLKVGSQPKANPGLCSSNAVFDKYRQETQKAEYYPPDVSVTEGKSQRLGGKSSSFHEDKPKKYLQEHVSQEGASVYCSSRTLRPQLGLGVITRQPAAKTKLQQTGQRSATAPNNSAQAVRVSTQGHWDPEGDQKRSGEKYSDIPNKSVLLKPGQSGLRPPGFSTVPASRLTSYGITRSSSVSSASNNQSSDSSHNDPPRPAQHPGSCSDYNLHKAPGPRSDASFAQSWSQPPNAPCLQRRGMPPQRSSPLASRREIKRDTEAVMSPKSSPKRFAVVSPKPQSSVCGQSATVHGIIRPERTQELDRVLIQQLRERCEQQALQLKNLQAHLKKANLCLDIFSITTQHFCHKSESAIVKERELSLELAKIRDEVAFSVAHWEQLQQEKQVLERRFESELQGLRAQQQRELGALEERLKGQHMAEVENLQNRQQGELDELQFKQQEQIEDMSENHEASLMEMEMTHNDTLATLQEEHARTVKNLKMAHEQQTKSLGEEFEKIRLSLQDQVDTLTFQNRCLRDRAKRFEEALRRSTDEQIVDALAPYKHIEEDLKSLKDILEMKNEQIHQQELKISELEKIAEKNVYLEERVQVLQQQNEDMKERIDKNVAVSRQLSEENANLQVHVVKESNEKKRLSRNNEELLWRLQTGELSPRMSPSSSPIHRPESGPGSPARPHSYHQ